MKVKFYMSGGHVVVLDHVKHLEMGTNSTTGKFSSYKITYEDAAVRPMFFSLVLDDIVAVVGY